MRLNKELWGELEKNQIRDKERYLLVFKETFNDVLIRKFNFDQMLVEKDFYYLALEKLNKDITVNLVPKELFSLFRKFQINMPHIIKGYTVTCGKTIEGGVIRLSCFGVDCSSLGKTFFNKNET